MAFNNVCRLCLSKNNLSWIFDERNETLKTKDAIYIATGIEITIKDIISQKICDNCYQFTVRILQFKSLCLKNDIYLKESYRKYLEDAVVLVPNGQITRKTTNKNQQPCSKPSYAIHPSIIEICKIYPQIKLPGSCLKTHLSPVVCMQPDQVEKYFKDHKLDIDEHIKLTQKFVDESKKLAEPMNCNSFSNLEKNYLLGDKEQSQEVFKKYTENFEIVNSNETVCESSIIKQLESKIQDNKKRKLSQNNSQEFSGKRSKQTVSKETGIPIGKSDSEPLTYVDKSVRLHVCSICDSISYRIKDLKKHQSSHTQCQFCKMKFRTINCKNHHIKNLCIKKKAMSNLPKIILERVEYDRNIRCKYANAFDSFQPIKTDNTAESSSCSNKEVEQPKNDLTEIIKTIATAKFSPVLKKLITGPDTPTEQLDVIEILSDEESSADIPTRGDLNQKNVEDKTNSLIKPKINIRNNHLLDNVDLTLRDVKVMKELLKKSKLHLLQQKHIQTDLYTNMDIIYSSEAVILKRMMQQLHIHQIPVVTKLGKFRVSYKQHVNTKQIRKLCLWDGLTAINIKPL